MKRIVIGVIIMVVGVFLLFDKMGLFLPNISRLIFSWQAIVIAIGCALLFDKQSDRKTVGIVLIAIGTLFILPKIFPWNLGYYTFPLIIIAAGVAVVVKAVTSKKVYHFDDSCWQEDSNGKKHFTNIKRNVTINEGNSVRKEYVFSVSKEKWTGGKLKNLVVEAVFSGIELDFSQAELAGDIKVAAHIKVTSVFSGITLYVPDDWNIMIQKNGVFGSFSDNRPNRVLQTSGDKRIVLELEAVFGGGEIRCYE